MFRMTGSWSTVLGILALVTVYTIYRAASDVPRLVSPQGCRMSWMSPSYLLQSEFNTSWTPLASRYTLWLYREVGWEPTQPVGLPALFIPGSAGSSHQVRSIASSAARQYFSSPFVVSDEFTGRGAKPLDFYAVDFNEDFSAFHGPTVDSQVAYTSAAINYILSRYPPGTQIIVMGHSMGGVVGTALLPSSNISALITMSTPHTLPPVRFDPRLEEIYARNADVLRETGTPILSLCGGATDLQVPAESCVLPETNGVYRRTVFTSALEGAWTGVGHLEMVWCHQVRWRVARAALELGATRRTADARSAVLDRWLRDGRLLPPVPEGQNTDTVALDQGTYETLPDGMHLVLKSPREKRTYLLPVMPASQGGENHRQSTFVLFVSGGAISGIAPHHARDLRASVQFCVSPSEAEPGERPMPLCKPLQPTTLKLLPNPLPGRPFPVPDEGSDESEGIVLFEGEVPAGVDGWVGISVDASGQNEGWVVGGFHTREAVESDIGLAELLLSSKKVSLSPPDIGALRTRIHIPRLPLNALLVYRLVPHFTDSSSCADPLFSPLLMHTSHPSEVHYHPVTFNKPIPLHSHTAAPYVPSLESNASRGLDLTIYSSGPSCDDVIGLTLAIDWWGTLGRLGARYPTTLITFCVGVASLVLFHTWRPTERPQSVPESLEAFVRNTMPKLMGLAALVALFPLHPGLYLGLSGELGLLASVLALLLVYLASGLVCVSWWILQGLLWPLKYIAAKIMPRRPEDSGLRRSTILSTALVLLLVFLLVPWQVAVLGCWFIQLLNCAALSPDKPLWRAEPVRTPVEAIPLRLPRGDDDSTEPTEDGVVEPHQHIPESTTAARLLAHRVAAHTFHQNAHLLLFLTWLLPLTAPVLVVWVRTLLTAGYTTPFNGDHNVFKVVPILWLVDVLGRGHTLDTRSWGKLSPRWGFLVVSAVSFLMGGRWAYSVYSAVNAQVGLLLLRDVASWYFS